MWRQADTDHYARVGDVAVCMLCKEPLAVGDLYWLDRASMMYEPPRVFHDRCRKEPE